MSGWVSFENSIGAHEKALALSDEQYLSAIGLLVLIVCWCDQNLTDGYVPAKAMPLITLGCNHVQVLSELERVGWLEKGMTGWTVHDYCDWQRSAEEIRAKSEQARRAVIERWRRARSNTDSITDRTTDSNTQTYRPIDIRSSRPSACGKPERRIVCFTCWDQKTVIISRGETDADDVYGPCPDCGGESQ